MTHVLVQLCFGVHKMHPNEQFWSDEEVTWVIFDGLGLKQWTTVSLAATFGMKKKERVISNTFNLVRHLQAQYMCSIIDKWIERLTFLFFQQVNNQ